MNNTIYSLVPRQVLQFRGGTFVTGRAPESKNLSPLGLDVMYTSQQRSAGTYCSTVSYSAGYSAELMVCLKPGGSVCGVDILGENPRENNRCTGSREARVFLAMVPIVRGQVVYSTSRVVIPALCCSANGNATSRNREQLVTLLRFQLWID